MRISSQQVFDSGVQSMQKHTTDVVEAQRQISSGRKFRLASDDALAAGLGVQIDFDKAQFAMFKVNQDHINASLASTDSQLNNIQRAMASFQQMMVQAGNSALGPENRKLLAQQAQSLHDAVEQFAQAKDANGQQILRTSTPPEVLVAPSVQLATGITYSEVMAGSGVNVLTFMQDIQTKLVNGEAFTGTDMSTMQAALAQVTKAQVRTGLLQNQLDAATEAAEVQKTNVELERSNLLDTDLATATANLTRSNALLQAAQSIMTRIDTNTLFQKL